MPRTRVRRFGCGELPMQTHMSAQAILVALGKAVIINTAQLSYPPAQHLIIIPVIVHNSRDLQKYCTQLEDEMSYQLGAGARKSGSRICGRLIQKARPQRAAMQRPRPRADPMISW